MAIHVTGEAAVRRSLDEEAGLPVDEDRASMEKGAVGNVTAGVKVVSRMGRPDVPNVVREETMEPGTTVGIAVCGPKDILFDARNAAAAAQMKILRGDGAKEVYLHSEHFEW